MAIKPFSGTWDENKSAHLLRRTLFGPTYKQIQDIKTLGLINAVDTLLTLPTETQPLTVSNVEEIAKKGETWVNKPYPADLLKAQLTNNVRNESLGCWLM